MKTKKTLKFSKETVTILEDKSGKSIKGGQLQHVLWTRLSECVGCISAVGCTNYK
ncbi:hypothetical protein QWZ06_12135 [Chryseobacterium tructae]|uniref:Uncharacterized protein n=1 Tax=Chryseobacterium tructae TaxID=1037380 RepID=A0ABV7XW77_9FLAO|nr:hypothetical protein [Chryseobacterium tructae]MDN3692977.1 hypothetical protein [Chryseobacterium tructae]